MGIKDKDIMEMQKWFEDALSRIQKVDRKEKMRMRNHIHSNNCLHQT